MVQVDAAVANPWVSWRYVENNWGDLLERTQQHVTLTVQAVLVALLLAVPLALLARGSRNLAGAVLGGSAVMYTVPSIALLGMLAPFTGIGRTTVLIALVAYAMLVLVRNILVGLDGVPAEVVDAARGLGHSRSGLFLSVELPLAMPAVITGLRLATVTTVALVTVGVVVGYGGLGQLMYRGFSSGYRAEIVTATVLCLAIALVADLLLLLLGRVLAPWSRSRAA